MGAFFDASGFAAVERLVGEGDGVLLDAFEDGEGHQAVTDAESGLNCW